MLVHKNKIIWQINCRCDLEFVVTGAFSPARKVYSLINQEISHIKCLNFKLTSVHRSGHVWYFNILQNTVALWCWNTPTSRNRFRLRADLSASFFRMGSSSSPSKRTIEARRTKRRRKTAAIRWKKRRKRQERCCREVRRRRARRRVWTSFGGGGADTPPEMFPSTPLYIRNT